MSGIALQYYASGSQRLCCHRHWQKTLTELECNIKGSLSRPLGQASVHSPHQLSKTFMKMVQKWKMTCLASHRKWGSTRTRCHSLPNYRRPHTHTHRKREWASERQRQRQRSKKISKHFLKSQWGTRLSQVIAGDHSECQRPEQVIKGNRKIED